jgi:hypothetical protein
VNRAFIGCDAKPIKASHDLLFRAFNESLLVGIFKAQNELTTRFTGKQKIEERGARASEMKSPCWRWRHACACWFQ